MFRFNLLDTLASLNESERRRFFRTLINKSFRALGLIIALGMIWMIWAAMLSRGLNNRNALESAQAARHLIAGDGFTTSIIRPLSFHFSPVIEHHPDFFTPPFMTTLKAALFMIGGDTNRMVILASGLGWIACALLLFVMVRTLSGRSGLAYYALALWCVNIAAGQYAVEGDNVTWSAALLTAVLWCLFRGWQSAVEPRAVKWTREAALREMPYDWALASGLAASLLTLCEPLLAAGVWIPLIWFWWRWPSRAGLPSFLLVTDNSIKWRERNIFHGGYKRRLLGCALAPAACLPGAWYIYQYLRARPENPFKLRAYMVASFSNDYPGESIFRYVLPPIDLPFLFWFGQLRDALLESAKALIPLPEAFVYLCGLVPLAFFVAGLFLPLDAGVRALRRSLIAPLLLSVLSLSLWSMNARYFAAFIPAILVVAVLIMHHVLGSRWRDEVSIADTPSMRLWLLDLIRRTWKLTRRHQVYGLFLVLAATPAWMLRINLPPKTPAIIPPGLAYLENKSAAGEVVLTDDPWKVAWYTRRSAVWLPQRIDDLNVMIGQGARFEWVYINNAPVTDPREIGDWWPELTKDILGWRNFHPIDGNFPRERILQRMD